MADEVTWCGFTKGLACTYNPDDKGVRACVRCGKVRLQRAIIGTIEQSYAATSPDAKVTLDDMMAEWVPEETPEVSASLGIDAKKSHDAFSEAMATETLTGTTASAFAEYRAATVGLRDSELGHKAAQDRYRAALVALNDAIAKAGA